MMEAVFLSVSREHRFWLEILQDHAFFLLDRIRPEEPERIAEVRRYADAFAQLSGKLDTLPEPAHAASRPWIAFAKEAHMAAAGYYKLEGSLQALLLAGHDFLDASPAFLNGTLTENQEYLRLLSFYVQGIEAPALSLWSLMEMWLDDQLYHAVMMEELLQSADCPLSRTAGSLAEEFRSHLLKNRTIHGFLRFTPPDFPEQIQFARDAAGSVVRFFRLLEEAIPRMRQLSLVPESALRMVEHHMPEASYFMRKLARWIPDAPGLVINRLTRSAAAG